MENFINNAPFALVLVALVIGFVLLIKGADYFEMCIRDSIRTPMNAIIGYAELASRHLIETEKLSRYLGKIQICGKELLSMLGNRCV